MTSLADFRYRRSYQLRVILLVMLFIMLSVMFSSTRADSITAASLTRCHHHSLFMIGLTSCLNIAMLLMSIDIMSARSHHATDKRRKITFKKKKKKKRVKEKKKKKKRVKERERKKKE